MLVIAGLACGEAKAELFVVDIFFSAMPVSFRYCCIIKAHQEFLVSASDVGKLVDTTQKWENGLKYLNYGFY